MYFPTKTLSPIFLYSTTSVPLFGSSIFGKVDLASGNVDLIFGKVDPISGNVASIVGNGQKNLISNYGSNISRNEIFLFQK